MEEIIVAKAVAELEPLIKYIEEINIQKENIVVVKEFLESRISEERNPESKVVLKLASKQLDKPIKAFEAMEKDLSIAIQDTCSKFAFALIAGIKEQIETQIKKMTPFTQPKLCSTI